MRDRETVLQPAFYILVGILIGIFLDALVLSRVRPLPSAAHPSPISASNSAEQPPPAGGLPKLVVAAPMFDFGEVERGQIVSHTFSIANAGDAPLVVTKVRTACGCLVAQMAKNVIPPAGQAQLEVKFDLALQEGPQHREIVVQSNDPVQPDFLVTLIGKATSRVSLEPQQVVLVPDQEDEPASLEVVVSALNDLSFDVVDTKTSGDNVQAAFEAIEAGKRHRVRVTLQPPHVLGVSRGWVHLLTNHVGEYRLIVIPVSATRPRGGSVAGRRPDRHLPGECSFELGDALSIAGPTLDQVQMDTDSLRGHPVLVVFWASYCQYCRKEMPVLNQLYEQYHDAGLEIVGLNMDATADVAAAFARDNNVRWHNVHVRSARIDHAPGGVCEIASVPTMYVVDREGKVASAALRGEPLRQKVMSMFQEQQTASRGDQ